MASSLQEDKMLHPEKLKPWPEPNFGHLGIPIPTSIFKDRGPLDIAFSGMFSMHEKTVSHIHGGDYDSGRDPHRDARETIFCFALAIDQGKTRSSIKREAETLLIDTIPYKGENVWHVPKEGAMVQDPIIFVRCTHFDASDPKARPREFVAAALASWNGKLYHNPTCDSLAEMRLLNEIFQANSSKIPKRLLDELEAGTAPSLLRIPNSYMSFMTPVMIPVPPKPAHVCKVCGTETTRTCSRCKSARYCCKDCQKKDWRQHKRVCKTPEEEAQAGAVSGCLEGDESDEPWVDIDPKKTIIPMKVEEGVHVVHYTSSLIESTGSSKPSVRDFNTSLDGQPKNKIMIVKVQIQPGSSASDFKLIWIYPQGKPFWIEAQPNTFQWKHYDYIRLHNLVRKRGFDLDLGFEGCKAYLNAYVRDDGVLRVMLDTLHPMQKW